MSYLGVNSFGGELLFPPKEEFPGSVQMHQPVKKGQPRQIDLVTEVSDDSLLQVVQDTQAIGLAVEGASFGRVQTETTLKTAFSPISGTFALFENFAGGNRRLVKDKHQRKMDISMQAFSAASPVISAGASITGKFTDITSAAEPIGFVQSGLGMLTRVVSLIATGYEMAVLGKKGRRLKKQLRELNAKPKLTEEEVHNKKKIEKELSLIVQGRRRGILDIVQIIIGIFAAAILLTALFVSISYLPYIALGLGVAVAIMGGYKIWRDHSDDKKIFEEKPEIKINFKNRQSSKKQLNPNLSTGSLKKIEQLPEKSSLKHQPSATWGTERYLKLPY